MNKPKTTKELTPSERGNIIWLSKSGYTPEAIARKTKLPLIIVKSQLAEEIVKRTCEMMVKLAKDQKDMPPEFNKVVDKMLDEKIAK